MVGIIGNAICIGLSIIVQQCCAQASVDIFIRDMNGRKVTQVVAGQPFNLHVHMKDIDGSNARVAIEQSRTIPMHRTSVQMRSINGRASTTHVYTARIDTRGEFIIGPVIVDDGTNRYESNQLTVHVTDTVQHVSNNQVDSVSLRLIPAKLKAYVGESIPFKLRFYYSHDGLNPERLVQPTVSNSSQSTIEGPFTGSETVNGVVHDYIEWRWDMIFSNAELYTIPSYTMEYMDRSPQVSHFGFFSSLFNTFGALQQVASNPVQLAISPLPSHQQASEFVGIVYDFKASLDAAHTAVGKAVVFALELITSHHGAALKSPLLEGLPRTLKYYESKVEVLSSETATRTRFEYILQPIEKGEWEIPSQLYTYFNVQDNVYHTIATDPLVLSVAQGVQSTIDTNTHVGTQEKNKELLVEDDIQRLHEMGPWSLEKDAYSIPWWLFMCLLMSPVWLSGVICCIRLWKKHRLLTQAKRRSKHAFSYARASIKQVKRTGELHKIPFIFNQLYADKWQVPLHEITELYVQERLKALQVSYAMQQEWNMFWTRLMSYTFTQENNADIQINELYNQVEQWLNKLNALL